MPVLLSLILEDKGQPNHTPKEGPEQKRKQLSVEEGDRARREMDKFSTSTVMPHY